MFSFSRIAALAGHSVSVEGFVHTLRLQSKVAFIVLRSGSDKLQCVAGLSILAHAKALSVESYVRVLGQVVPAAQAPGGFELQLEALELISKAGVLPLEIDSALNLKLDHPVARFRQRKEALILITSSLIERGLREYLYQHAFTEVHSPKLMGAPSESGAEVFKVRYFDQDAYLAQSPQFYKQMAIMSGLEKVFEIGSVFRAEPSFSSRHATEFVSVDVEIEGIKCALELIEFECAMLIAALASVGERMGPELLAHYPMATAPGAFVVLEYAQAQALLGQKATEPMSAANERELGAIMQDKGAELVALTHVPYKQRPFYHMQCGDGLTNSYELLYRGVEITTGAVREHRHALLIQQLHEKGLHGKDIRFYLDSFKLGAPPHGGFGLGLARLTALFLGLPGIKEAVFIHRDPGRLTP